MARKKAASKNTSRKSAETAASRKSTSAPKAKQPAAKKDTKKTAAVKKAANNDIVLLNESCAPDMSELEAAFMGKTKSMGQFRSELGWEK